jgi:hypothetical protein
MEKEIFSRMGRSHAYTSSLFLLLAFVAQGVQSVGESSPALTEDDAYRPENQFFLKVGGLA